MIHYVIQINLQLYLFPVGYTNLKQVDDCNLKKKKRIVNEQQFGEKIRDITSCWPYLKSLPPSEASS